MKRTFAFALGMGLVMLTAVIAQQGKPPLKKVEGPTAGKTDKVAPKQAIKKKEAVRIHEVEEEGETLKGLPRRLEQILERLEKFQGVPFDPPGPHSRGFSRQTADSSVKVEVTPDGVKVEIREKKDGKEEVKKYEAGSLEEFKRLHPEVARKYGIGGDRFRFGLGGRGFSFRGLPGDENLRLQMKALQEQLERMGRGWPRDMRRFWTPTPPGWRRVPQTPPAPAIPGGERGRLGVMVKDVAPELSDYLDLPPGLGFLVDQVLPNSLAHKAGVKAKDLVVSVNGRPVHGVSSIREALLEHTRGDKVKITVLRKGHKLTLEAGVEKTGKKVTNKPVRRLKRL